MNRFLKGNYGVDTEIEAEKEASWEATEQEFYKRATEKLGGSIAFIMKSKNLLWKGDEAKEKDGTAGS